MHIQPHIRIKKHLEGRESCLVYELSGIFNFIHHMPRSRGHYWSENTTVYSVFSHIILSSSQF